MIIVVNHDDCERSSILFVKHWNSDCIGDSSDLKLVQVFLFSDERATLLCRITFNSNLATRVGFASQAEIALHPDRVDRELADLLLIRRVSRRRQTV